MTSGKFFFTGPRFSEIYKIIFVSVVCVWDIIYKGKINLVLLKIRTCNSTLEADMKLELYVIKNNIDKCICGVVCPKPEGDEQYLKINRNAQFFRLETYKCKSRGT